MSESTPWHLLNQEKRWNLACTEVNNEIYKCFKILKWPKCSNKKNTLKIIIKWAVLDRIITHFWNGLSATFPDDFDIRSIAAIVPEMIREESIKSFKERSGSRETKILSYIREFLKINNMEYAIIDQDYLIIARLVLLGDISAAVGLADKIRE